MPHRTGHTVIKTRIRMLQKTLRRRNVKILRLQKGKRSLDQDKARLYAVIDALRDGYFETDPNGTFTFCNQALLDLSGYARNEFIGKNFRTLSPPRTTHSLQAAFGRLSNDGQASAPTHYEVFHKKGHTLTIELTASLILDADGDPSGYRGTIRDVTEQIKSSDQQRRLQSHAFQAQKMEALGTLAGGLAHGFNNVLMAIQGNLSLIRMNLPPDKRLQTQLDRIGQSTDKGVHLAKQILSFAKMGKFVVMATDLNTILKSTSRMFMRSNPNLRFHEYYESDLWETQVDRVQIGQLLLSLYMNAAEAMPDGGDIYLHSENMVLDANYTKAYDADAGRFVKISVTDNSVGLPKEARERIFEPFYSAYSPTRFDGLGLAAVYGTIKSHRGIINVYSEIGHGTTFSLYIPTSKKDKLTSSDKAPIPHGHETILLVDDDDEAARVARVILENAGYHVIIANSGDEGIGIYKELHPSIDLVLLDIIMPDLDGDQVYTRMKAINANILVVLVSGYSVNKQIAALLNRGCVDFIQKPFQTQTLTAKVRLALDRAFPVDHVSLPLT